jgi:hypothetical protein
LHKTYLQFDHLSSFLFTRSGNKSEFSKIQRQ